ncbi:MAG: BACON domain-containing protein [Bacteroidales bacterium]|nr:BACON domain-containing protein [Bacteroidales bacterium]
MKKLFPLLALMCIFVLQGCPKGPVPEPDTLDAIKTEYTIGAAGGELTLSFKTNQTCSIKSDASWLTVLEPTKAVTTKTTTVKAEANPSTDSRKANVKITAGTLSITLVVTQEGLTPKIDINGATQFPVGAEGGSVTVDVTSNVDYEVEINANWVTRNGTTFTVEPNDSENDRTAVITFRYGDISKVVSIKQNGKQKEEDPYLDIAPTTKNVAAAGETFTVTISTNQGNATGSSNADWVTVSGTSVTVAANPNTEARSATVTFTAGSLSKTVTINQAAKSDTPEPEEDVLETTTPTFTVSDAGEDIEVIIKSNVEYSFKVNCDWITYTKATSVKEDKVKFHVAANSGAARTATIDFTYGSALTVTVTVKQNKHEDVPDEPVLEITPKEAQVAAEGGTVSVTVNANYPYTAETDDEWLTVTQGEESCTIAAAANTAATPRTGLVQFSSEGLMEYLTVVQAAAESDEDPFDVGSNLSVNGTANCYVVTKAGNYTFDASVMGNGADGFLWDDVRAVDALLWPQSAELTTIEKGLSTPAKVFVYWNDGDVIKEVKYSKTNKTISFTATGNKGAALIGLFDKFATADTKNEDEAIWSWLIWCTDPPKMKRHFDLQENEYILMDRNLGATSADPADGTATYGYYFQWGRPAPLKAYIGMARDFQVCESDMKTAITHPAYVYEAGSHTLEWYNTGRGHLANVTADLWGDPKHMYATVGEGAIDHHPKSSQIGELRKTIYDPCPPGFMVAPEKTWQLVGMKPDDQYAISFIDDGVIIPTENGDSFYPYQGYIATLQSGEVGYKDRLGWFGFKGYKDVLPPEGNPGTMCHDSRTQASVYTSCTGTYNMWTDDNEPSSQWLCYGGKYIYLSPDGNYSDQSGSLFGSVRQRGFPVRCVKEFK